MSSVETPPAILELWIDDLRREVCQLNSEISKLRERVKLLEKRQGLTYSTKPHYIEKKK